MLPAEEAGVAERINHVRLLEGMFEPTDKAIVDTVYLGVVEGTARRDLLHCRPHGRTRTDEPKEGVLVQPFEIETGEKEVFVDVTRSELVFLRWPVQKGLPPLNRRDDRRFERVRRRVRGAGGNPADQHAVLSLVQTRQCIRHPPEGVA